MAARHVQFSGGHQWQQLFAGAQKFLQGRSGYRRGRLFFRDVTEIRQRLWGRPRIGLRHRLRLLLDPVPLLPLAVLLLNFGFRGAAASKRQQFVSAGEVQAVDALQESFEVLDRGVQLFRFEQQPANDL
jgi:hypothetical protein